MRPDDFQALLRRRPFEPFRLHLSSGVTFDIRHPELALVGRSFAELHIPAANVPMLLAEREVWITLLHIVRVEFLELSSSRASGNGG